jgi:hypothetical protein
MRIEYATAEKLIICTGITAYNNKRYGCRHNGLQEQEEFVIRTKWYQDKYPENN